VLETGTALCHILRSPQSVCENDSNNNNVTEMPERSKKDKEIEQEQINHIVDDLSLVTERRKRCCELVELRMNKLSQLQEIVKCEEYTEQV
jgi:hypothetical protein